MRDLAKELAAALSIGLFVTSLAVVLVGTSPEPRAVEPAQFAEVSR